MTSGTDAVFKITVTNDGTEDLTSVVVTDEEVPACSLSEARALLEIQAIGNNDSIFNVGESFEYECTDEGVTEEYTNVARVDAVGVDSGIEVDDTNDSEVKIYTTG